ncbi:DUF4142 domain-containing protein [Flavobacterium coralii]|uniref:DUF4142 domain-containing protein n=1 Tax=Flavobacterium coralii TaxID=2838017 RepID=UPI000C39F51C|nr:DUF305 domain-containing protein [Flavobacterium sp.]
MKKTPFFSKIFMGAAVLSLSLGTVSCKDDKNDPAEVAEEQNEEKFDDNEAKEDDSEYLVMAAEVDMKEIELGKLAQQKATNADVKAYGQMMVTEHQKASDKTKELAQKMNVSLPMALTEKGQEAYDDLNDETGMDFDKKYIDMMVDGHEKTIDKMEDASENANSEEVRMWAANMLPTLRQHLDRAKQLKEQMDNNNM